MTADPILRIYTDVAALETIAANLPEKDDGLAHILDLLSEDIRRCGEALEARETAMARR